MDIAVSLQKFLAEHYDELVRELTADGSLKTLAGSVEEYRQAVLQGGGGLCQEFHLCMVIFGLERWVLQVSPGTKLEALLALPGTLNKYVLQSYLSRGMRTDTAYAFKVKGSNDDVSIEVSDDGIKFCRTREDAVLDGPDIIAELFVPADCTGSAQTLGELIGQLREIRASALSAFNATFDDESRWSPTQTEAKTEGSRALAVADKLLASLAEEDVRLLLKYPKALEVSYQTWLTRNR